jgi:hypothetical protein
LIIISSQVCIMRQFCLIGRRSSESLCVFDQLGGCHCPNDTPLGAFLGAIQFSAMHPRSEPKVVNAKMSTHVSVRSSSSISMSPSRRFSRPLFSVLANRRITVSHTPKPRSIVHCTGLELLRCATMWSLRQISVEALAASARPLLREQGSGATTSLNAFTKSELV